MKTGPGRGSEEAFKASAGSGQDGDGYYLSIDKAPANSDAALDAMQSKTLKTAGSWERLGPLAIAGALVLGAVAPAQSAGAAAQPAGDAVRSAALPVVVAGDEAQRAKRPRIGLVLGGGGARAFAHIGVLQVLEELRVPVDAIVGSSIGALVGGLYASGMPTGEIERLFSSLDWSELSGGDLSLLLRALVRQADGVADLAQLPIPFSAVATDLETGEVILLSQGPLSRAMRASFSITGAIQPLRMRGRVLADGGLVDNLPVSAARVMKVDQLIVVDVGLPFVRRDDLSTVIGLNQRLVDLLAERNAVTELASVGPGDLLIRPGMTDLSSIDFAQAARAIELGRVAARKVMAHLQALALSQDEYLAHRAAQASRAEH